LSPLFSFLPVFKNIYYLTAAMMSEKTGVKTLKPYCYNSAPVILCRYYS